MFYHWKLCRAPIIFFIGLDTLNLHPRDHQRFIAALFLLPNLPTSLTLNGCLGLIVCGDLDQLAFQISILQNTSLEVRERTEVRRENAWQATSRCDASEASPSTPFSLPGLVSCSRSPISEHIHFSEFLPPVSTRIFCAHRIKMRSGHSWQQ